MATVVDIINRALQALGTRTNVTAAELANETSNEAIQANLSVNVIRQDLLRMAPWNCANTLKQLDFITAAPGMPQNTSPATLIWLPGQPQPPWAYEYQYPVDCLRPCFVVPQSLTGQQGGVPITTAVTGGAPSFWQGPPVKFKVSTDEFYPVTAATVQDGGTGFLVGDEILLAYGPTDEPPVGGPARLRVLTAPAGVIATVEVINQVLGEATPKGGSYFKPQTNPVAIETVFRYGEETTLASGATFNLTFGSRDTQRVILTNQEYALLNYIKDVTNVNVMDTLFQSAWTSIIAATLAMSLTGDKGLANSLIAMANADIMEARKADGNEGLTINDVTPDFIRARGIDYLAWTVSPGYGFEWGSLWAAW